MNVIYNSISKMVRELDITVSIKIFNINAMNGVDMLIISISINECKLAVF